MISASFWALACLSSQFSCSILLSCGMKLEMSLLISSDFSSIYLMYSSYCRLFSSSSFKATPRAAICLSLIMISIPSLSAYNSLEHNWSLVCSTRTSASVSFWLKLWIYSLIFSIIAFCDSASALLTESSKLVRWFPSVCASFSTEILTTVLSSMLDYLFFRTEASLFGLRCLDDSISLIYFL